jgi:KDO2-lipid IV(A) lauroyltransferase
MGRSLGRLLADLDRRHVAIAMDNLRHAFPEWDESRRYRTARAAYAHFGAIVLDLLWLQDRAREEWLALSDVEGAEHPLAAQREGRGVLYVAAHFGHWEALAVTHSWRFGSVAVVTRPLDNPALDARLSALRGLSGNEVISKRKALGQVLRTLREGRGVAILMDQNVQAGDGIFVDFFGRKAATTTVVAALAVKTGCAVVAGRGELRPDGRIRCVYDAPVVWQPSGDREADIAGLTQALTSRIEGWIRERPEQWLWIHRRWKTRPPEEQQTRPAGEQQTRPPEEQQTRPAEEQQTRPPEEQQTRPAEEQHRHPEGAPSRVAPEGSGHGE